jgi:dTDP-4-dehydrorhamnose reductase
MRTAWVYSPWGKNFVRTMLLLGSSRPELKVVADQVGNPTSAWDIAEAMITVATELLSGRADAYGTYHYSGLGATSWHGFAEEIFRQASVYGWPVPKVHAIPSSEFPTPVTRPANSQLNCHRIAAGFGVPARPWQQSLGQCLGMLMPTLAKPVAAPAPAPSSIPVPA